MIYVNYLYMQNANLLQQISAGLYWFAALLLSK